MRYLTSLLTAILVSLALVMAACNGDSDTDDTNDQTDQEPSETVDTIDQDDSTQQPTDQTGDGDTTVDLLSDDVPSIEMVELSSGESVSLRSLVDGERPVLLWFWAPHCPICRGEAPDIEELAQENSHRLKVVGVGAFDDLDYAHRFVADTGTTFTMLWSESAEVWNHYGVRVNSHFWLLEANGNRIGTSSQAYNRASVEGLLEDIT